MRVLELAKRNFKEIVRDKFNVAFLLGMPLVFMLIFGFAFRDMGIPPLSLGVVNYDQTPISRQFIGGLGQIETLKVSTYDDEAAAKEALRVGDLRGVLIIPDGFSDDAIAASQGTGSIDLEVVYDEARPWVEEQLTSTIISTLIGLSGLSIPVDIESNPCRTEEIGYMNYMGPGMTVFGLLILIPVSASLIARDKETAIMPRLLTTPLKPWQFIADYFLPYVPVLIIQIAIYLGIAYAFGLNIVGNLGLAFFILFILGLSSLAMGMILGSFIKHDYQAHFSWIIIVPMAMLSGAWFPTEGMHPVMQDVAKAFPSTYAISAAQDVISRGLGFGAIANDVYILLGFAVGLFIIGVILFRKRMLV